MAHPTLDKKDGAERSLAYRTFWVLLVACSGIVISIVVFALVYKWEQSAFQSDFEQSAELEVNGLRREIDAQLLILEGLAGLYDASDNVTMQEFKTFIGRFTGQTQAIRSLEWIPLVRAADRDAFEEKARKEGFSNFQITEKSPGDKWIRAGKRDEYFPIYQIEPLKGNRQVRGWDLASNPDRLKLLEMARDSGKMIASGLETLVQDDLHEPSFMVVLTVYLQGTQPNSVEARRSDLVGFCRAVFRISDMLRQTVMHHTPTGLDLYIFDKSAPAGRQLLYFYPSRTRTEAVAPLSDEASLRTLHHDAARFKVAQREWLIRVVPAPARLAQEHTRLPWIALTGGLLFTGLMTSYVMLLQRSSRNAIEAQSSIERAQGALKESEERFRSVIQTASDAIVSIDTQGKVILWNKGAEDTFGYSADEMVGKPITTVIPERFRELHENALQHRSSKDEPSFSRRNLEVAGLRPDGTEFPAELSIDAWTTTEGKFFTGIVRDITDRKNAERSLIESREAAEQASRAKSEFLANMSHEIRTPMNGIIGMTELTLNTELTIEQREFLDAVKTSADSLLNLINDILDFSKIEAGKLELMTVDFSIRDTLADTMTVLAVQAHKKGLELLYDIPPQMSDSFIGDPGRLRQVLVNLVGNSIKFTHEGQVSVNIEQQSEKDDVVALRFSVSDTGIGISPEKKEKIFGAFEQADASTTRKYGGTGLGLSLSRRLIEMMGGRIWVESEMGKGSTFHFTIPLSYQRHPVKIPIPEQAAMLKGVRVLVVDDNATNRQILDKTLLHWEMNPTLVESGWDALAALEQASKEGKPFPLMITDCMMPEMDGFDLVERINANPQLSIPAIIMCTSAGERGDAARCMNLAVAGYLIKPIKQSDLLYTMSKVLNEPSAFADRKSLVTRHSIRESKRRLNILLAEDNLVNQKLATKILEKMGHTVSVAGDGEQAVETWTRELFDLILMDVQMPNMDGLQATRAIREKEKTSGKRIPIVAMTARAMKGDEEECLEAGMDGYLSKPIHIQELSAAIDNIISEVQEQASFAAAQGEGMIDRVALFEQVGGDKELLTELVSLFVDDSPRLLSEIRSAVQNKDALSLEKAAHSLKGAVANFAAKAAADAAFRLEVMGRTGELAQADGALIDLEMSIDGAKKELLHIICGEGAETASAAPGEPHILSQQWVALCGGTKV